LASENWCNSEVVEVFMRSVALLSVALLLTVLLFAKAYLPNTSTSSEPAAPKIAQTRLDIGGDGERMWTRAEIRVLPLELVSQRRVQLDSLRARVAEAKADDLALARANPRLRKNVVRDINLMYGLLSYIEHEGSDQGKTIAAIEVQKHLNEIEGRVNCSACHSGVVARSTSAKGPTAHQ
jgi:hypothetical protein